ncbi:DUF6479 family protein [Streptomyces sp. NPDC048290]|uniref:DUF6479 family protein n=1 Tax=Streptomyces sp. NPDC048290 TaxID=3155811 RepID=UPI00342E6587
MTLTDSLTGPAAAPDLAAPSGLLALGPLVVGVVVVAVLIGAFLMGIRVRRGEPPPPRPEEQPRVPPGGPVRETRENRVPDEVPRGGRPLTPYELTNMRTRPGSGTDRPRWSKGGSGSFGGGGLGAH